MREMWSWQFSIAKGILGKDWDGRVVVCSSTYHDMHPQSILKPYNLIDTLPLRKMALHVGEAYEHTKSDFGTDIT